MAIYRFEILVLDAITPQGILFRLGADPVRRIRATVETNSVRYRYDGGAPTPTVGHLVAVGDQLELPGADACKHLRLIATAGTATVYITEEAP